MNKEQLIDYLYGEMSAAAHQEFEIELLKNPAIKQELEELTLLRSILQKSEEQQSIPLKIEVSQPKTRILSRWWTIAASILALMMAGNLLGLQITVAEHQMNISYGQNNLPKTNSDELKTTQQFTRLEGSIQDLRQQIASYRDLIINESQQNLVTDQKLSNHQLTQLVTLAVQKQQTGMENRVANKILEEQQTYIQSVAQDMLKYWEDQRKNDLQFINTGLNNLAQSLQLNNSDLVQLVNNPKQNY